MRGDCALRGRRYNAKLTRYQAPTVLKQEALTELEQSDAAGLTTTPGRYSFEPRLAVPEC